MKIGDIRISEPVVSGIRICTVGVEKFYWGEVSYVHEGAGLLGTAVISN